MSKITISSEALSIFKNLAIVTGRFANGEIEDVKEYRKQLFLLAEDLDMNILDERSKAAIHFIDAMRRDDRPKDELMKAAEAFTEYVKSLKPGTPMHSMQDPYVGKKVAFVKECGVDDFLAVVGERMKHADSFVEACKLVEAAEKAYDRMFGGIDDNTGEPCDPIGDNDELVVNTQDFSWMVGVGDREPGRSYPFTSNDVC